jgi:galactose oxidase
MIGLSRFAAVLLLVTQVQSQDFPWARPLSRSGWTASANSFQTGFEPSRAIDGNASTLWQTVNSPSTNPLPHQLTIDLQRANVLTGFSYQPRTGSVTTGIIRQHALHVSDDGTTWRLVAEGLYLSDNSVKYSFFTATVARYIRLTALSEVNGNQWASAAEVQVYTPFPAVSAADFVPVPPSRGRWGPTIQLPIVPAAATVTTDNVVMFWAAHLTDNFPGGTGVTFTSTYDLSSRAIETFQVTNNRHDMFCPGTSIDEQGRLIVTGGNDAAKTSIYTPGARTWSSGSNMARSRGYQASTTIGDGRIFVIGGSWSGGTGNKHGEVYNVTANAWTRLDGCDVARIQTNDPRGPYTSDNHAWLFAWRRNLVFHAGPSTRMTWFNVSGTGSWREGGTRGSDPDSMSGTAAMYDAEQGLILTTGGSTLYSAAPGTRNAHVIQLVTENALPTVSRVADMSFARAYHNSVILPNGNVVVIGGQSYARNFQDSNSTLPIELFDHITRTWSVMAPLSIPRNYHGVALLLPDARVLSGGGGLCGRGCLANHPDAQIWTPPYLLTSSGAEATRPQIVSVSGQTVRPGGTFQITTDVASTFALVRYGAATHTVNTDQRRVVLRTTASGLTYTATLPTDPGVLVPGPWMLFALNGNGVPSLARTIRVTR